MTRTFLRRSLFIAAGTGLLLYIWFAWCLAHEPQPAPRTIDLLILGRPQLTNGAMLVSVVLSNGTSRSLNVVDDTAGNPFLGLVTTNYFAGYLVPDRDVSGPCANMMRINLAAGASLTNTVWITNPPPRFRLRTMVRDMHAEFSWGIRQIPRSLAVRAGLLRQRQFLGSPASPTSPTSPWIESGVYPQ